MVHELAGCWKPNGGEDRHGFCHHCSHDQISNDDELWKAFSRNQCILEVMEGRHREGPREVSS